MPAASADIRRDNLFEVLRRMFANAPVSRQDLTRLTGLSLATVASVVSELLDRGLLQEAAPDRSRMGRPLTRLLMNPAYARYVGVDVAETYIHAELFDSALTPLAVTESPVSEDENDPGRVADQIATSARDLLARHPSSSPVLGVGVSVPGLVDNRGGVSLYAPNWNWHEVPLRNLLRTRLSLPLYLDNPLKALAVSQLWSDTGLGGTNLVLVNLGTGVGAGIAVGGALYRGTSNSAGEWGHTTIDFGGRPCHCGASGCLEAYIGAPGIVASLREIDPTNSLLREHDQAATLLAIRDGNWAGNPVAKEVIARTGRYLGAGLANLINLINPERIVLCGWVMDLLGEPLKTAADKTLRQQALAGPLSVAEIHVRHQNGNPVSRGAATLAMEGSLTGDHTEGTH